MSDSSSVPTPSSLEARSAKEASGSKDLQRIQRKRKLALRIGGAGLLVLVAVSQSLASRHSQIHDLIEALGLAAIGVCIFGRGWCALYIGGRKKTELVTSGPYSMCRNPLYVFSVIGAFGVGAQTGSLVMGLLFSVLCWLVFRGVVQHEEEMLSERFGSAFERYVHSVPRFRPTCSRWRDEETLVCKPALFLTTIRDAIWFLAAVPVFEGVKLLQDHGWLKPMIRLP